MFQTSALKLPPSSGVSEPIGPPPGMLKTTESKAKVFMFFVLSTFLHTSSVSPEMLQAFADGIACIVFFRNLTLLAVNMKANRRASYIV